MERLFIVCLAVAGTVWKVDLGARVYVDWFMMAMLAAFMFTMGARLDDALRRWEAKPHWRRSWRPPSPEPGKTPAIKRLS